MIRTEHLSDSVTLHLGDCRDILPTLDVGFAVVSDVPFGMNYRRHGDNCGPNSISSTRKVQVEEIEGDKQPFDPKHLLGAEEVCLIGAEWFYDRLPAGGCFHVWNKRGPYKPMDQADGHLVWMSQKQPLRIVELVWRGICRTTENTSKIEHPTQKPIALMEWCIERVKAKRICDPYMGSGTTGVAAVKLGRGFDGIEKIEKFFDIACRRVSETLRQPDIFRATGS
jgi:hypothetical protein